VLGTETDWLRAGKYSPAPLAQMDLWRTLSGAKPYLLLMNTDYDQFNSGMVEKYFDRCLFYGMWPGFFSHNAADNPYWRNPRWYERDRPLFKKYLPAIRDVAQAGWRPLAQASCDNTNILVEQFGPGSSGETFLTLFNDTSTVQEGALAWNGSDLPPTRSLASAFGLAVAPGTSPIPVTLQPQRACVLRFAGGKQ